MVFWWLVCLFLVTSLGPVKADDATHQMFGDHTDGLPAAFGDFNSDELTDLFVIREKRKTLEILLGQDKEPTLHSVGRKCSFDKIITSVVPGDFNGDALMDVMVTLMDEGGSKVNEVVLLWGEMTQLNCTQHSLFKTKGQPLAIDYDKNMIIDLFGLDEMGRRCFWIFSKNQSNPTTILMNNDTRDEFKGKMRIPHSNAFLDLTNDNLADLYITTEDNFEIWRGNEDISKDGFTPWRTIKLPESFSKNKQHVIGQTVFLDVELKGKLDHLVPFCFDVYCENSRILVLAFSESDEPKWIDLNVNFHEDATNIWRFTYNANQPYTETITLRAGDFNMDGYPDLLVTLTRGKFIEFKTFFLMNVPCKTTCSEFSRTFEVQWNTLSPHNNNTVLGIFYDFLQDGVLDVIFVHSNPKSAMFNVSAYRNTLDYDANFVKVMVVTGLTNPEHPLVAGPLRKSASVYGTNLPGPKVMYSTTTQEGDPRTAVATQIPQSAHFSLNLPYIIFGLGRTPNFIDTLTVQIYGKDRQFTQLIPNSQMVVIPWPITEAYNWKVQLFVTPSKLIFQSVLALLATCVVISLIIAALYWKERKEDHLEKLQEAHRFHFDAM